MGTTLTSILRASSFLASVKLAHSCTTSAWVDTEGEKVFLFSTSETQIKLSLNL